MRNGLTGIILLLVCFWGCTKSSDPFTEPVPGAKADHPASESEMSLTLSYNAWPGNYPLILACEKGFFAQRGLTVNSLSYVDTQQQITDFTAKTCEGGMLALGSMVEIAGRGSNIAVIFITDKSDGADAVVAIPSIKTVGDLKGKRIGTVLGGFGELFALEMLQRAGLNRSDLVWLRMDGSEVPERLKRGEIDAGGTWEPYISQSMNAGAHPIFTSHESDLVLDAVAFHKSVLREKKQAVQAFVDGWFDAVDYWLAHQEEVTILLSRKLKKPETECSLKGIRLFSRNENRQYFEETSNMHGVRHIAQRYAEFCASQGNANVLVKVDDILDTSFLQ